MDWILIALIAPLLWSVVNHVDKFLLSRYFNGGGAGGLMIFIGVTAVPFAGIVALLNPGVLAVAAPSAFTLIASGVLYNVGVYLYLLALEKDEASTVVPFMQLVPVFAYILGVLFLGEFLSEERLFGGLLVLTGALLLSVRLQHGAPFSLKARTPLLMALASFVLALGYVLFKDSGVGETGFWISMFWNQVGMLAFGFVFFLIPHFRREFLGVIQKNSVGALSLNIGEQIVEVLGVVANNFAILLAPAALVILVEYGAQPVFVFLFGALGTLLLPRIIKEDLSRPVLLQKAASIALMSIGLVFVL